MNVLGHTCFRYLEKLPNIMYYITALRHVKTTILYLHFEQDKGIKLVSHWVIYFVDRNCKYRHNNLHAIFHTVWLISNCPWNNYGQAISQKRCYYQTWHAEVILCLLHLQDCLLFFVGDVESKSKAELKTSLNHSTLKGGMAKALLS